MNRLLLTYLIFSVFFCFCNKIDKSILLQNKITKDRITGSVQKGPFLNGTQISIFELNKNLSQTGKVFNTSITDSKGSFSIENIELESSYVFLSANGFYFDEIQGKVSSSQITLNAISDITDESTININILTHLERKRVEYLFKTGISFKEAKKTAQNEIFKFFGFEINESTVSEKLDISNTGEENAKLLAISLIIQGKLDVGNLSELLASMSNDFEEDGRITDNGLFTTLISNAKTLEFDLIRLNLVKRYQELNINATIPVFEKYIKLFLLQTASVPLINIKETTSINSNSAIINFSVNPNGDETSIFVEYGLSNNYGFSLPANNSTLLGENPINISFELKNLDSSKTYHYRIKAQNSKGTTYSKDTTFFTFLNLPVISTLSVTDITDISAVSGGNIISNSGVNSTPIITSGIVWSTTPNPQITINSKTINGSSIGLYTSKIEGLTPGTLYYLRAYATNLSGTSYGNEIKFITENGLYKLGSGVKDIDGNSYRTIIIGNFEWMAENLKTTKYSNGDNISQITDTKIWYSTNQGAFTVYDNNQTYNQDFGKLYNFYAVSDTRGVCPVGWQVPTFGDLNEGYGFLISFLGGSEIAGGKMKLNENNFWNSPNIKATNQSGFSALPGGYIWPDKLNEKAQFGFIRQVAIFWSATKSSTYGISIGVDQLNSQANDGLHEFNWGHSIRCVRKL